MMRTLVFFAALAAQTSAHAQSHRYDPGPPTACVTAVYDAMTGTWGRDDESFVPNHIPVSAWQIIPQDGDIVAMLTSGETNVWFLTEHGADRMHDLGHGQYDGVLAFRLLSCQEGGNGEPGVIESTVSIAPGSRVRERLEVHPDYFTIQHFDRRDRLVDEQRMRRYTVIAVAPPPAPPSMIAVDPPPAPARN